jgi:integrase
MAKRKHLGVTLIKPEPARERIDSKTGKVKRSGAMGWRVRYVDPDTGRAVKRALDRTLTTIADREDYAVRLSERLGRRRLELEGGAVRATGTPLRAAEKRFYSSLVKKRERTRETYREGTDRFLQWAEENRVQTCDDLTRGQVIAFREALLAEDVAAATFNKKLRGVKRMLAYWIDADLCPNLDHSDLRRVKQEDAPTELRDFLTPAKVRKLLEACERHDAATYALTREEKAGGKTEGSTPRYEPISGFALFVLLTGCRLGEALGLAWQEVDLEALDHSGKATGQFQIRAADSKTRKPRTVYLDVSPALRRLMAAQKLRTGGRGKVWDVTEDGAIKAMRRLRKTYGAPASFAWQAARRTCSTFLVNSPGIFGSASAYRAAKQLGHGVDVMERHYSGLVNGIDPSLRNLEGVLGIKEHAARIVKQVSGGSKRLGTLNTA